MKLRYYTNRMIVFKKIKGDVIAYKLFSVSVDTNVSPGVNAGE